VEESQRQGELSAAVDLQELSEAQAFSKLPALSTSELVVTRVAESSVPETVSISAAQSWLEQKSSSGGWTLALLETNALEATRAVDLIEELGDLPASKLGPSLTLEARDRLVDYFQASDMDIAVVKRDDGSFVMFDRSDVANGDNLSLLSWTFDQDGTTIAILGHSSVIADAAALVA